MTTRTFSAFAPCIALACIAPSAPQEPASGAPERRFVAAATICVNGELGMGTEAISSILNNSAYLASFRARTFPNGEAPEVETKDTAFVDTSAQGEELVAIRVMSQDRAAAKGALDAILESLPKLESSSTARTRTDAEEAAARRSECTEAVAKTQDARAKLLEANGALEPGALLERARGDLSAKLAELDETRFRLGMQQSVRDLLKERLAVEPAVVEEKRTIPNAKRRMFERQLQAVTEMKLDSTAADALNRKLQLIEQIEKQLADGALADTELTEKAPNPRRAEMEQEIFELDKEVVRLKASESALSKWCDVLRTDATRLARLDVEWQRATRAAENAEAALAEAESHDREAQNAARRLKSGAWIRVVAGPRVD